MKIAILGTRGVPNNYGGFEQFAQYLSEGLVQRGHKVFVYNSHNHPYRCSVWNGVNIIHCNDPEQTIGTFGQFIYDFNCILDTRRREFDAILQLGYTSSSIWNWLIRKDKMTLITNMDGMEWRRSKYSYFVRCFLRYAESLAIKYSDILISDSKGIQSYLKDKYNVDSKYIPYGSHVSDVEDDHVLDKFNLIRNQYAMIVSRMEPENNIEMILSGFITSDTNKKMVVVGNMDTRYGRYIRSRFIDDRIIYLGYINDIQVLNSLRFYSYIYFHGHSVGGTNPSLLEAIGSHALICAHDNLFNRDVLGNNSLYFLSSDDVVRILNRDHIEERERFVSEGIDNLRNIYSWKNIVSSYEHMFLSCL